MVAVTGGRGGAVVVVEDEDVGRTGGSMAVVSLVVWGGDWVVVGEVPALMPITYHGVSTYATYGWCCTSRQGKEVRRGWKEKKRLLTHTQHPHTQTPANNTRPQSPTRTPCSHPHTSTPTRRTSPRPDNTLLSPIRHPQSPHTSPTSYNNCSDTRCARSWLCPRGSSTVAAAGGRALRVSAGRGTMLAFALPLPLAFASGRCGWRTVAGRRFARRRSWFADGGSLVRRLDGGRRGRG